MATTAILGAGIVALGTAASLPAQGVTRPAAAQTADSPVAGIGLDDGVPAIHGSSARFDPRVGFTAPRPPARASRARVVPRSISLVPANLGRLTSCFCARWGTFHNGLDIAAPMLTPIYAAMDGEVETAGAASGFGNVVIIRHDSLTETLYGHMERVLVDEGQRVKAGQIIALVGNRGQSTGPHLHFEVHRDGRAVDPAPWLERRGISY